MRGYHGNCLGCRIELKSGYWQPPARSWTWGELVEGMIAVCMQMTSAPSSLSSQTAWLIAALVLAVVVAVVALVVLSCSQDKILKANKATVRWFKNTPPTTDKVSLRSVLLFVHQLWQ